MCRCRKFSRDSLTNLQLGVRYEMFPSGLEVKKMVFVDCLNKDFSPLRTLSSEPFVIAGQSACCYGPEKRFGGLANYKN